MVMSNGAMAGGSSVGLRAMVLVFLAMACISATVTGDQISQENDGSAHSVSEFHSVPAIRFPQIAQGFQPVIVSALVPEQKEKDEDLKNERIVAAAPRSKLQWSFNPFKPWETFKVARSAANEIDNKDLGSRKRAAGCRMWRLFSGLFGRGHRRREHGSENAEHHQHAEREDFPRAMFSRPFGHGFQRPREENGEYHHHRRHIGCGGLHHNVFFRLFGHRLRWPEHHQQQQQENAEEHRHEPSSSEQHNKDFHMWRRFPHGVFDGGGHHVERFENHHRPSFFPWSGHRRVEHYGELRPERLEQVEEERGRHFGRKQGIMARAKAYFADVCHRIRGWVAPAFERKPPTIQSAPEPLEVNRVQVLPRMEVRCQLREKLASVIVPALKEVGKDSPMVDKENASAGVVENLRKMLGHEMQFEIQKQLCDGVGALSPHGQKFCEIFRSNPKIGVLMVFSKLHIDPLEAALDPKGVANRVESFRNMQRVELPNLSESDSQMLKQVNEAEDLGQMVYDGVQRALQGLQSKGIGEHGSDFKDKVDTLSKNVKGRERSPCEVCLHQKIRHIKKLAGMVAEGICEGLTDSPLADACAFVDKNEFVAKTMFAYKFKIWKVAVHMCESQMSCDFSKARSGNNFEKEGHGGALTAAYRMEDLPKVPFVTFDVNSFHHPRILEIRRQVFNTDAPHHFMRRNSRNCALHRAKMLRGNQLDFLSAELEKVREAMVRHAEGGPVVVGESHVHPFIIRIQSMPFEFHPMESVFDLPAFLNHEAQEEGKDVEGFSRRHGRSGWFRRIYSRHVPPRASERS